MDLRRVRQEAERLSRATGGWVVLTTVGPRVEQVVNTVLPSNAPLPAAVARAEGHPEIVGAELRSAGSGRAEMSDVFVGRTSGRAVAAAVKPLTLADGREAVLYASFAVDRLSALLARADPPKEGFLSIVDGSGRVVARSEAVEDFAFAPAPEWFLRFREVRDEGLTAGPAITGLRPGRFRFAVRRLSEAPGWTLAASRPAGLIGADLLRFTWPAMMTAAAFTASLGVSRRVARGRLKAAERERALAEAETAREAAERADRAKARLLSTLAHEIRTPLLSMLGSLEPMSTGAPAGPAARRADAALAAGRGLLRLIDDVLELSRLGAGTPPPRPRLFDPVALARETADLMAEAAARRGDRIEIVAEGAPPTLVGEVDRIRRVLINLVSNAVKHTENGIVSIEVDVVPAEGSAMAVAFAVRDTGSGIAETDLPRLFRDFGMLEPKSEDGPVGTGLGLAICRRLAKAMGGAMEVESRLGEGSVFRLRLTLPRGEPGAAAGIGAAPQDRVQGLVAAQVLLVDDEETIRELTLRRLEAAGARVVEAADGLEAVTLARARRFDLVLMDLTMPGMSGIEAIGLIRGSGPSSDAMVAALTAHAGPERAAACRRAGADAVLSKPVALERIAAVLTAGRRAAWSMPPDPDAAERETPVFERDVLSELETTLSAAQLARMLERFAGDVEAQWAEVRAALDRGETAEVARLAHRLAGLAATLGARRLADLLRELEVTLEEGEGEEARRLAVLGATLVEAAARSAREEARGRDPQVRV